MAEQSIIESIYRYIERIQECNIPVSFVVLYGSYAWGNFHKWRDIDVDVVSPVFDGDVKAEDVNTLWRVAGRTDSRIEPIGCGLRQWTEDTSSAIIEIARREGQQIMAA